MLMFGREGLGRVRGLKHAVCKDEIYWTGPSGDTLAMGIPLGDLQGTVSEQIYWYRLMFSVLSYHPVALNPVHCGKLLLK